MAFNSSDFYVLKNAVDRHFLEAKSNIRVRTQTLLEIGAKDMISQYDLMEYEAMDDSVKYCHCSDVLVHPLRELVNTLECPKDEEELSPVEE